MAGAVARTPTYVGLATPSPSEWAAFVEVAAVVVRDAVLARGDVAVEHGPQGDNVGHGLAQVVWPLLDDFGCPLSPLVDERVEVVEEPTDEDVPREAFGNGPRPSR